MKRILLLVTGVALLRWAAKNLGATGSAPSRPAAVPSPVVRRDPVAAPASEPDPGTTLAPVCQACGSLMQRAGSLHVCPGCGQTDAPTPPARSASPTAGPDDVLAAVVRKAVGPTVADRILADFPSREALRDAPDERLLSVKGLGRAKLARLRGHVDADLDTLLDGVRGLGPAKRARVVGAFPTAMMFLLATDEELSAIDGVGPVLAADLASRRDTPEAHTG